MDRLDAWLNAQRGWRRLVLTVMAEYPLTIALGYVARLIIAFESPISTLDSAAIAVLALPGAIAVGSLMAALHARRAQNSRRKRGQPPFFVWRQIAAMWVLLGYLPTRMLLGQRIPTWMLLGQPPFRSDEVLALIVSSGYFVLSMEAVRYRRRFTGLHADPRR